MKVILTVYSDLVARMSGGMSIVFALLGLFDVLAARSLFFLLSFAAMFVVAVRFAYKCTPKLQIDCGRDIAGCVKTAPWADGVVCFFRIAVNSSCVEAVRECQGQLTRIAKDGADKWSGDIAILTFAPGEHADATSKLIRHRVTEYLDVLAVNHHGELFVGTREREWPYYPPLHRIFEEPGRYLLTVKISAISTPTVEAELQFTWTGRWSTSGLSIARSR